jgi:serine/threonine protein kinase
MTLATGERLGRYEILQALGAGGMGEVYRARDSRLDRDVAIKVLPDRLANDATALSRFDREMRAVAALSHPNILTVHDVDSEDNTPFAVMELLEGETLGARLSRSPLSCHEAVRIALAIAEGLAEAHAKEIVHRDIKPENIFLTTANVVKILDFGLARFGSTPQLDLGATENFVARTEPGVVMGTVSYMSPEQARGQPTDVRSDIFSFGCMLFEMVTGRRPFARATSADTIVAILHESPPALSESGETRPRLLDLVIARCLAKDADARFDSGRELADALREVLESFGNLNDTGESPAAHEATSAYPATPTQEAPGPSVAVLPFVNMSSDEENEYFSDGLVEELTNMLVKLEGLHVPSRTSAFAFKGKSEDIRAIGEQLGVLTVLQGSVRKAGNRLRISAQLLDVGDGHHLWSETYDRQLEDVFAIQEEIAKNIAGALKVILNETEKAAVEG